MRTRVASGAGQEAAGKGVGAPRGCGSVLYLARGLHDASVYVCQRSSHGPLEIHALSHAGALP